LTSVELVIEGGPRPKLREALRELWRYRAITVAFAERAVRLKYKQAALGAGWAVIQPLAYMGILTLTLGRLAKVPGGGVPYAVFVLSALVPWTFVQTGITFGTTSLITDASLVRKVYFPREIPVLGSVLAGVLDFCIGLLLFLALGPALGAHLSPYWLLAPFLGVILFAITCGAAFALASLTVYYRDFRHALPFLLQLWLFASPVAYPLSVVPAQWRGLYVVLNPTAGVLDAFRRTLALGQAPSPSLTLISFAGSLIVFALGYRILKTLEPNFAEVI
jgi:ABC-type polysaccharide/polyol phosphate export permease